MADRGVLRRVSDRFADVGLFATRHQPPIHPHPGPTPEAEQKSGATGKSGALRAGIFGVNDGLLSNLSLIMGVSGASVQNHFVVVAGVAGLLAGAFSMAAGEYVSMRVQRELFERLLSRRRSTTSCRRSTRAAASPPTLPGRSLR